MIFDLVYLLLMLTGVMILIENRISRIIVILALQGILVTGPVFHVHSYKDWQTWAIVGMVLVFKAFLTPYILSWIVKRNKYKESTHSRFGFIASLFLMILGLVAAIIVAENVETLPEGIKEISLVYVFLLIYLGVLAFILRQHWIPLIAGFVMFENGIFTLTMLLDKGLPFGTEFGSFLDAVLVIVAAAALRLSDNDDEEIRLG